MNPLIVAIAKSLSEQKNSYRIFVGEACLLDAASEKPVSKPAIAGGVILTRDGRRANVYHLAVHPQFRGGGLGKALTVSLWGGFALLTFGLLSGAWFTQLYTPSPELRLGWKIAWAVLVWIWYLATLLAKNVFNRPSKRIAQMSLAGFMLLAMTYFGMGVFKISGGGL